MQERDKEKIRELLAAVLAKLESIPDADTAAGHTPSSSLGIQNFAQARASSDQLPPSSHPGLQRFISLENAADPRVSKHCFMEPDRECVHSGACEMRGF